MGNNIQTFTTPGAHTWTKPVDADPNGWAEIMLVGGGGGGGGGRQGAAGTNRQGGGGGGGGCVILHRYRVSELPASATVTVGAGGAGGLPGAGLSTDGIAGGGGQPTVFGFGSINIQATGGGNGFGGSISGGGQGATSWPYYCLIYGTVIPSLGGGNGATTAATKGPDGNNWFIPTGGGGGGGVTSANTTGFGARGGAMVNTPMTTTGAPAGQSENPLYLKFAMGLGGGGGGTGAGSFNGGDGIGYGGGGGGGGGQLNGVGTGTGGRGADGYAQIICPVYSDGAIVTIGTVRRSIQ
jgi:hypothetical protein